MAHKTIGIVGGMGSYAGIDLARSIFDRTPATVDQEHLPVHLISTPHKIEDRTAYLLGEVETNPGIAIGEIIQTLHQSGAEVIGVACNTAHVPKIFDVAIKNQPSGCKVLNLIEEIGNYITEKYPNIKKVGILGTTGTINSNVYPDTLSQKGLTVVMPSKEMQTKIIQPAIYDTKYGLKAFSNPPSQKAVLDCHRAVKYLSTKGAEIIVLACTEFQIAIKESFIGNSLVVDSLSILAQALIRESKDD